MKKTFLLLVFVFIGFHSFSQKMLNYKVKTKENEKDRTMMLDILRATYYPEYKQEFVFVVNVFNVANNYAWFKGTAQRKDGKLIKLDEEEPNDCCHVEALFKNKSGKWYIVESVAFSTDVWYDGIWERVPEAPKIIFGSDFHK